MEIEWKVRGRLPGAIATHRDHTTRSIPSLLSSAVHERAPDMPPRR
jgi:hypothetical protein